MKYAAIIGAVVALAAAAPAVSSTKPAARLDIPSINVHTRIYSVGQLDSGPAWWPYTSRPGRGTTVAIAGHRTTHSAPFRYLNRLKPGWKINITYGGRRFHYEVKKVYVRPVTDLNMAAGTPYERLLLTACSNPDGTPTSLSYRIVVWAKLVDEAASV